MRRTVGILGTPIDAVDTAAALNRLEEFIQDGRFHQIATANTDFLINAATDPELALILRQSDLVLPDGMPVVWASRLLGTPLPERVAGADLVPMLAATCAKRGYRVYMLGARPEVASRARAYLEARCPGLQIVGCVSPEPASLVEMDSAPLLESIAQAQPHVLLVAFGNPKQEKWISMHREELSDVPVCIGVGGTFDFLAGELPRAPVWLQRCGMEWSYRLAQEPRRLWRRYVRDIAQFSRYWLRQAWALRSLRSAGTSSIRSVQVGPCTVVSIYGDLKTDVLPELDVAIEQAFTSRTHLILDLQHVTSFDGEAIGVLIQLAGRAAYYGCGAKLVSVPQGLTTALATQPDAPGLPEIAGSLAEAFLPQSVMGLRWRVTLAGCTALVSVSGASDALSAHNLDRVCRGLLESGRTVYLDARKIDFADTRLLGLLYRISQDADIAGGAFRLIPGQILQQALARERVASRMVTAAPGEIDALYDLEAEQVPLGLTEDGPVVSGRGGDRRQQVP